jgi:Outer membrane protein beta-barrel domain
VRKFKFIVLSVFIISAIAAAQTPTGGNIFLGYSYSKAEEPISFQTANLNGWEGTVEGKFLPWIGLVADFGAHYGSVPQNACLGCPNGGDIKRYTILFGPRVSVSIQNFTPFAHALVGIGRFTETGSFSDTSFASAIGGGLDYKLIKGLAWRIQGDELHTRFFSTSQDHLRLSTGIVFRF